MRAQRLCFAPSIHHTKCCKLQTAWSYVLLIVDLRIEKSKGTTLEVSLSCRVRIYLRAFLMPLLGLMLPHLIKLGAWTPETWMQSARLCGLQVHASLCHSWACQYTSKLSTVLSV